MADSSNPATGGAPKVERLQLQRTWEPPSNPLLELTPVDGDVQAAPSFQPQFEAQAEQGQHQEQVEVQPQQNGQRGNFKGDPFARMRILEKEKRKRDAKIEELEEQLSKLTSVIAEKLGEEGQEEEEVDPANPLEALVKGQQRVREEIAELRESQQKREEMSESEKIESFANQQIRGFAAEADKVAPGLYQNAMAYLANVKMMEQMDDHDLSEEDARAAVADWVANIKQKALKGGENPGEVLFRRATMSGFDAHGFVVGVKGSPKQPAEKPAVKKPNAAAEIKQELQKKQALSSISGMQGSSTQDPLKGLAGLSESDRVKTIYSVMRERGDMRRMRSPSLDEMLAHKKMR